MNVDIKADPVRRYIRQALQRAISAAVVTHHNADDVNTPAAWWHDAAMTRRQEMETSASLSISGSVITLRLNYYVKEVQA